MERIKDAGLRASALVVVAVEMAKAGMFEQALKVAEEIERAEERASALSAIAEEMAMVGMGEQAKEIFDQALKVAEEIENAFRKAEVLGAIAKAMTKAGMAEWAKEIFEQALKIVAEEERVLVAIAVEMARAGMFEQTLKVAERIKWARGRAEALGAIAKELSRAGMVEQAKEVFDQALKVVEEIENAWQRAKALEAIAKEMVKAGEVEGAVGIVKRATGIRTEVLPSILEALAERASEEDGKSKEGFLRLLPLCGWSLELSYRACGWLARLYHEQGEVIELISNLSEQWQWSHTPEILRGRSDSHHRMPNRFWGTVCQVVRGAVEHFFGWFKRAIRSREHNC
jgi:tetratricopeptide (TPR) repeat protein